MTGALVESQPGAPDKLAPSSRMPRLELPRVFCKAATNAASAGSEAAIESNIDAEGGEAEGATTKRRDSRGRSKVRAP